MSLAWKWDPPQGWQVDDSDAFGLAWVPEAADRKMEEKYRILLDDLSAGPDGYRAAMEQVLAMTPELEKEYERDCG